MLKYSAEWNGIKVGNAELFLSGTELFNDVETYQITFTTRTNGLANTLFPIRDRVDVWIDKKELFTHRIKKDINQSTYKEKIDVSFNYDELKALSNDKSVDIDFKARGPYSMFYFLRTIDLIPEKIMSFSSYEGKRIVNYNLKIIKDCYCID